MSKLTDQQIKKIENEIIHTNKMIEKELKYSPEFRKTEYLALLNSHLVKLNGFLNAGSLN